MGQHGARHRGDAGLAPERLFLHFWGCEMLLQLGGLTGAQRPQTPLVGQAGLQPSVLVGESVTRGWLSPATPRAPSII